MEKVFAVVVTFNGLRWLDRCIGSLLSSDVPVSVVVVDNASTDGTPERIAADFPDVHLIRSDINYGFAKANNIGIRYALDNGADYVFLLNQDAWVEKESIGAMVVTFSLDPGIGVVSPMHMNGAGDALDWKFATNMSGDFVSDCYLGKLKPFYKVPYINAAAWLISAACLKVVGGFDTNLFVHYGEDIDFTHRLTFWNYKLVVNPASLIFHDREFRRGNDDEYKRKVFQRDEEIHSMKLQYGNINVDFDIDREIKQQRNYRFLKLLKFNFIAANRKTQLIQVLEMIKLSREKNKYGDGPWL